MSHLPCWRRFPCRLAQGPQLQQGHQRPWLTRCASCHPQGCKGGAVLALPERHRRTGCRQQWRRHLYRAAAFQPYGLVVADVLGAAGCAAIGAGSAICQRRRSWCRYLIILTSPAGHRSLYKIRFTWAVLCLVQVMAKSKHGHCCVTLQVWFSQIHASATLI
jgi:hypothetical protein